jgi:transposase
MHNKSPLNPLHSTLADRPQAKLGGIDPRAWLADVLARLPGHPAKHIDDLLPWNWQKPQPLNTAA